MRTIRSVLLAVVAVTLAWLGGRIFDAQQWTLFVAALLPLLVARVVVGRRRAIAAGALVVTVLGATTISVVGRGGGASDLRAVFTNGVGRVLSTEWPSPVRPELVGVVALLIAAASAIAGWLAGLARLHLMPLVPLLVAGVGLVALGAPAGTPTAGIAIGGAAALAFAAGNSWSAGGRGDRSTIGVLLGVMVVGTLVGAGIDLGRRADPRDEHPPIGAAVVVDPLDMIDALTLIDPPIDLFTVSVDGDLPAPSHWRLLAADRFDGERWLSTAALRPIGRRLAPSGGEDVGIRLRYETNAIDAVPLPGEPVTVEADVSTDASRALVRLEDPPSVGDSVAATVRPFQTAPPPTASVRSRPIDAEVADLTDLARAMAGSGTTIEQLRAIEATLHDDYALTTDPSGDGVQQALIERFLHDSKRGTAEQFVVGFVLLARAIGVDARVAAGFEVPAGADPGRLTSDMAAVWPEVYVDGSGWVVFAPVPERTSDAPDASPPVQRLTPVAPQPPSAPPPPEQSTEQPDAPEPPAAARDDGWREVVRWALRVGGVTVAVLAPFVIAALAILAAKRRRRRRLLGTEGWRSTARGTWAVANDVMVDAGMSIDRSWTDRQIAAAAGERFEHSADRLRHLGDLSSAATFARPDATATAMLVPTDDDLVAEMERFEQDVVSSMSRWRRWRYRLSLRSLRRGTSSPVSQAVDR